ncbi:MAG: metallophosphoesterase [Elusimicrobia bacterium]|nr:metallophosphoesterase [Candidatus Liberimonas magnetica]
MKLMVTTDLHGNTWKYKKLYQEACKVRPDVLINAGDMFPNDGNNLYRQKEYIENQINEHFYAFNKSGMYYLCFPGNDDLMTFDGLFQEVCDRYPYVKNIAQRKVQINGYDFIGMSWVVDYPFLIKDRCRKDTEDREIGFQKGTALHSTVTGLKEIPNWKEYVSTLPTIEEELEKLERPANMKKAIYVTHMPPCNLELDVCINGERVGSEALYFFIRDNQPLLTLHGHIHESPAMTGCWKAQLDSTICIQAGQTDDLVYVVVNLETMECERVLV